MSFHVRVHFAKAWLHRTERACFMVGFGLLGFCAFMLAQAWFYQAYQNWAFEQQLRGAPVSYTQFIADIGSPPPPPEVTAPRPALEPNLPKVGFEPSTDRSIVGRMEIPRIGLKAMIHEGISHRTLALAVGHIPGTALPGQPGNVGIAGHRDTFFRGLREVHPGDTITLTTFDGSYDYRVESTEVVAPRDTRVLEASNRPELTLVTCYPFFYVGPAPERFIVHARRVTAD